MKTFLKTAAALIGLSGLCATAAQAETVLSVTQTSYNYLNKPVCTAVRMNPAEYGSLTTDACALDTEGAHGPDRIVKNTYNAAGELTQADEAYGTSVQRAYARYTYTNNGLKATEKDANGNLTTLEYDGFDRLKRLRYPSTTIGSGTSSTTDYEEYAYDVNGNRTYWRRRDGQVINDCFDNLNRIIVHYVHAQSGCTATGGAKDVYTSYDGLGRITSKRFASAADSGVSYIYDGLGRVSQTIDMNGRAIGYTYNQASARTSLIYPDLNTVGLTLDNANRLSRIGWNSASGLLHQTYYNQGWISAQGKGNAITIYGYHATGQLSVLINDFNGAANDVTWTFAYNPAGQIQSSSATSTAYDYDELTTTTTNKTYDGLNRDSGIVSVGGYDTRGNLTYEGTGGRTMTYDIENRLLTVNSPSANLKLEYDPEGRLYRYSTDGGATWTTYLYDGVNLIGEYAGTAALPLRRYIHGSGTDNPLVWLEGSGATNLRWFYTNYQGSVVGIGDGNGVLTDLYKYDPYGRPMNASNVESWSGSRFRYTGQTMIPEARLYYYKARVYDPAYGRFLQTDPIGSEDDLNLYGYVKGDPVNNVDPTGNVCQPCLAQAGIRAGGRYLVAGITTQVDSPLPGPADVVGAGIAIVTTGALIWDVGSAILTNDQAAAPPANNGNGPKHGSDEHNDAVDKDIKDMKDKGYTDVRKNQTQVDASGKKVGNNRPDAQGTRPDGTREYREQDKNKKNSEKHGEQIKNNDPNGVCILNILGSCG